MNDDHINSIAQIKEFIKLHNSVRVFKSSDSKEKVYEWIDKSLGKFRYFTLRKKDRSIIKSYIIYMTGYSEGAVDKLICRKKKFSRLFVKERTQNSFDKFYQVEDISLLAEVNNITLGQNGKALKEMCRSMYDDYGDTRFDRLAQISVSHLYNLKKTNIYKSKTLTYTKTNPVQRSIGVRKKPNPNGKPGYLRVDSVHQGDLDKEKGVYHINLVDEVTQAERVICVEGISEYFLLPLLGESLKSFPFKIIGFHSDNGSEYINHQISNMLNKMVIEQTKSRSRKTNDNALVEGKNGAVIRKMMGYIYIPKKHAESINSFYFKYLNPYLNYHRFCAYPTDYVSNKGKIKKKYEKYMTPIDMLMSIPDYDQYLNEGVTKESLLFEKNRMSHFEAAKEVFKKREQLFVSITRRM